VCLAVAMVHLAQGFIGGSDVSRIAWPAAPLVWAVALGSIAAKPGRDLDAACAVLGSILLWRPFQVFNGSAMQYLRYFLPEYWGAWQDRIRGDRVLLLIAVVVWLAARAWRARRSEGAEPELKPGQLSPSDDQTASADRALSG